MSDAELEKVEEIWVNVTEGAEITGYHPDHVRELARNNWKLPNDERLIKIRKRSNGYDIWLPDLIQYKSTHGKGPQVHNRKTSSS
jgi:hypothetical protein